MGAGSAGSISQRTSDCCPQTQVTASLQQEIRITGKATIPCYPAFLNTSCTKEQGDACQDFYIASGLKQQLSSSSIVCGDGMKLKAACRLCTAPPAKACAGALVHPRPLCTPHIWTCSICLEHHPGHSLLVPVAAVWCPAHPHIVSAGPARLVGLWGLPEGQFLRARVCHCWGPFIASEHPLSAWHCHARMCLHRSVFPVIDQVPASKSWICAEVLKPLCVIWYSGKWLKRESGCWE